MPEGREWERPSCSLCQLKHEHNYAVSELEGLAVVWALTHFHYYIVGQELMVYTDHAALQSLFKASKLSGRLMRWLLKLQQLKPVVKHRLGAMHVVVNALSRLPQAEALQVAMAMASFTTLSDEKMP